jgi:hypothetical protein
MTDDMKTMTLNSTIADVIPAQAAIQYRGLLVRAEAGSAVHALDARLLGNDETVRTAGE